MKEGNAYFGDLADQPDMATDIFCHSGTVHAGCDISHIEAIVARKRDWSRSANSRRVAIRSRNACT